jgi:hypothetical protein
MDASCEMSAFIVLCIIGEKEKVDIAFVLASKLSDSVLMIFFSLVIFNLIPSS